MPRRTVGGSVIQSFSQLQNSEAEEEGRSRSADIREGRCPMTLGRSLHNVIHFISFHDLPTYLGTSSVNFLLWSKAQHVSRSI
jgi:hypothetical protein